MKKSEIVAFLKQEHPDFTEAELTTAVDAVFDAISDNLSQGNRVEIRGFGSFLVKERAARTGRNPSTGEPIEIKAKNVVQFKPGKELKKAIQEAA